MAISLALLIVTFYLVIKIMLFHGLEYTSDVIVYTQKSQSFLSGLPVLYDTRFGPHPFHGTYIILLLAPFTYLFGSYALFAASAVAFSYASYLLITAAYSSNVASRFSLLFATFVLLLGPLGFWAVDDPIYGWHPEQLTLPFAVIFAVGLAQKRRFIALSGAAFLALTHEAGPLVAWAVHCSYQLIAAQSRGGGISRPLILRVTCLSVFWGLVFIAGILFLRWWDPSGAGNRLQGVLGVFIDSATSDYLLSLLSVVWNLILLLFACSFIGFLVHFQFKAAIISAFCALPLVATGLLSSLAYNVNIGAEYHNIFWPPRFVLIFAASIAGLFINEILAGYESRRRLNVPWLVVVAATAIGLQVYSLNRVRNYSFIQRIEQVLSGKHNRSLLSAGENTYLSCLARSFLHDVPVFTSLKLWAVFHRGNLDGFYPENSLRQFPQVIVCDKRSDRFFDVVCNNLQENQSMAANYAHHKIEGIETYYDPKHTAAVAVCVPKPTDR